MEDRETGVQDKNQERRSLSLSEIAQRTIEKVSVLPILVLLFILFSILSPTFLSIRNMQTLLSATIVIAIAGIGETLVLLTGGLDLSVASVVACSAVLTGQFVGAEGSPFAALLVGLAIGLAFGLFNGFAAGYLGLTPLILTLGTHLVARGIAFTVSKGYAMEIPEAIAGLGRTEILLIPTVAFIGILLYILFAFLLRGTNWGRYIYMVGANPVAAQYVGIRRVLVKGSAFAISGLLAGFGGFVSMANLGVALPGVGDPILLTIIGGVILGGTSLFGGKGTMLKTAIGILLMATLRNGLNLLGFRFYDLLIAEGIVIVLGMTLIVKIGKQNQ